MSELVGDISLVANILSLFLVGVGVVGRRGSKKDLMRHGYLSILGFAIKLTTVFAVMIPPLFSEFLAEPQEFSLFQTSFLGFKIALGIAGTIMGFICIVPWLLHRCDESSCLRLKRWMWPTLAVWTLSVILGSAIHLGGIM